MKKVCKIALIFLIILNLYMITFKVQAIDIWGLGKNFLDAGADYAGDSGFNPSEVNNAMKDIINFLWGIGLLIVAVSTVVLGIKYMMVNPNEKSRVKQATTPYIIGVVIIFGAVTVWKLVIDILEGSLLGR